MKAEVSLILGWMFRDVGGDEEILVIGDSTCAYCVGAKWETSWRDLRAAVCALPGGGRDVHFGCVSGANVADSPRQAQDSAACGANFYDWVFVAGGWNSSDLLVFRISPMGGSAIPPPNFLWAKVPNTSEPGADRTVIADSTREFIPYCIDNISK